MAAFLFNYFQTSSVHLSKVDEMVQLDLHRPYSSNETG